MTLIHTNNSPNNPWPPLLQIPLRPAIRENLRLQPLILKRLLHPRPILMSRRNHQDSLRHSLRIVIPAARWLTRYIHVPGIALGFESCDVGVVTGVEDSDARIDGERWVVCDDETHPDMFFLDVDVLIPLQNPLSYKRRWYDRQSIPALRRHMRCNI